MAIAGNLVYLVLHDFNAGGYLHVLDVSNPEAPTLLGSLQLPDDYNQIPYPYKIVVQSGLAYIGWADGWTGGYRGGRLDIVDVSDPFNLTRRSNYETTPGIRGMALDGNKIFLCLKWEGLDVVDVQDPDAPVRLGGVWTGGAVDACTSNGHIFLGNGPLYTMMIFGMDSDSDGLFDNQETGTYNPPLTYGSSPDNPDTNGDGVLDGLAAKLGHDPNADNLAGQLPAVQNVGVVMAALLLASTGWLWLYRRRRIV